MAYKVNFIKLILIIPALIFLEFCPPSGKNNFNVYIFLLGVVFLIYAFYSRAYIILGLILTLGNGLTRLSHIPYPTVSFLILCIIFGFFFSIKNSFKQFKLKCVNFLPLYFFLFFLVSSISHIVKLIYPNTIFVVNHIGYLNTEIIFHIVGYELFVLFVSIFLFYTISLFYDEEKNKKIFVLLVVGIIINSVVGILQFFEVLKGKFEYIIEWEKRVSGLFSHFNSFSLSLVLLLPMFLFYFSKTKGLSLKILFFISFMFGFINLILTGTRSGILCFLLVMLFVIVYLLVKKKIKVSHVFIFLSLIIFSGLFISIFHKNYSVNRIINSFNISRFLDILKESRIIFWDAGIKLWKKNPLIGNGIKSFYKEFPNITNQHFSDNACNTYINFLSEIGVLGTLVFLLIVLYIIYSFVESFRASDTFRFFINATLISFLISSFFGHHLDAEEVSLLFWFYLALSFNGLKFKFEKYVNKVVLSVLIIFCVLNVVSAVKGVKEIDVFKYKNYAGLYHVENIFGKKAQWAEKKAFVKLDECRGKNLVLEMNPGSIKNQEVKIFLNDEEYTSLSLKENIWVTVKIPITQDRLIVKILPKYTFCPAGKLKCLFSFHGKDYRILSIALRFYIV